MHGCSQLQVLHIYQITADLLWLCTLLLKAPWDRRDFMAMSVFKEMINSKQRWLTMLVQQLPLNFYSVLQITAHTNMYLCETVMFSPWLLLVSVQRISSKINTVLCLVRFRLSLASHGFHLQHYNKPTVPPRSRTSPYSGQCTQVERFVFSTSSLRCWRIQAWPTVCPGSPHQPASSAFPPPTRTKWRHSGATERATRDPWRTRRCHGRSGTMPAQGRSSR